MNQEKSQRLWRNPLRYLAVGIVLSVATNLYKAINVHQIMWKAVVGNLLAGIFLVLYIRRSRFAWVTILVMALLGLIYYLVFCIASFDRLPSPAVLWIGIVLWLAIIAYILLLRDRYYAYVAKRPRDPNME